MSLVLVANAGSSSLKFKLFEASSSAAGGGLRALAGGLLDRIGDPGHSAMTVSVAAPADAGAGAGAAARPSPVPVPIRDHVEGMRRVLDFLGERFPELRTGGGRAPGGGGLAAVGHRIVHGLDVTAACLVTPAVKAKIREASALAPLHNPAGLAGIEAAEAVFGAYISCGPAGEGKGGGVPQVAVFDTAFHCASLPQREHVYPLPWEYYAEARPRVRKYGFHGTSHKYLSLEAARMLRERGAGGAAAADAAATAGTGGGSGGRSGGQGSGGRGVVDGDEETSGHDGDDGGRPPNLITLHLGNGSSAAAVERGRSVATSMGMTPLEGLMMGTRSGDLDPAVPLYLMQSGGLSAAEVDALLNKKSGLLGVCGASDVRAVLEGASGGDARCALALEMFAHRARKYVGAYTAVLGGDVDALVFSAGVGENSPVVREMVAGGLERMGVEIDRAKNYGAVGGAAIGRGVDVATRGSRVRVLVVPTDEELMIAREALAVAQGM